MRTDTEILDFLCNELNNWKWADIFPWMRPVDSEGEYTEKYIFADTFREGVNAFMDREEASTP